MLQSGSTRNVFVELVLPHCFPILYKLQITREGKQADVNSCRVLLYIIVFAMLLNLLSAVLLRQMQH